MQINLTEFGDASKRKIFGTLVDWWLTRIRAGEDLRRLSPRLVDASLQVYAESLHMLLPTPTRSHYTFNLRDISKVFQGMQRATGAALQGAEQCVRLWAHETVRVFSDRLIDSSDRQWFAGALQRAAETHFKVKWCGAHCFTALMRTALGAVLRLRYTTLKSSLHPICLRSYPCARCCIGLVWVFHCKSRIDAAGQT